MANIETPHTPPTSQESATPGTAATPKRMGRPPKSGETCSEIIYVRPWTKSQLMRVSLNGERSHDQVLKRLISYHDRYWDAEKTKDELKRWQLVSGCKTADEFLEKRVKQFDLIMAHVEKTRKESP